MKKICTKCNIEKELSGFIKDNTKTGYTSQCKICRYESLKIWKNNNKKRISEINKKYINKKLECDSDFKLLHVMRVRIKNAIKNQYGTKAYKSIELLGCTTNVARFHLESQFTEGMSWENYGDWHIDHIRPCASFDLTDPEQQKECFHYTNIQPLWAKDNLKKSNKY